MILFPVRPLRAAALTASFALAAAAAAAQQPAAPSAPPAATPDAPAATPPTQTQPLKFAWLNSQAVLAATPGRSAAESLFTREMVGFRAEVQRLQAQFDSTYAEYNRASPAMTPAARTQREEQLRQMQARNQQRAQELDQQAQAREAELTRPIMDRVNAVIEGVRAEFNFAFVFDVSAQGNPIVTADRALDITQLVIGRLQAAGPPTPPVTGPVQPGGQPPMAAPGPVTPVGPRVRPRPSGRP